MRASLCEVLWPIVMPYLAHAPSIAFTQYAWHIVSSFLYICSLHDLFLLFVQGRYAGIYWEDEECWWITNVRWSQSICCKDRSSTGVQCSFLVPLFLKVYLKESLHLDSNKITVHAYSMIVFRHYCMEQGHRNIISSVTQASPGALHHALAAYFIFALNCFLLLDILLVCSIHSWLCFHGYSVEHSSPEHFFTTLEAEHKKQLCKWVGELYLELHRGTYTSQAKVRTCMCGLPHRGYSIGYT